MIKSFQPINHDRSPINSNDNNSSETGAADSQAIDNPIDKPIGNPIDNHLQRIKALTKNVIRNFDDGKTEKSLRHAKCDSPIQNLILVDANQEKAKIKHDQVKKANPIMAIENMVKNQVAKSEF